MVGDPVLDRHFVKRLVASIGVVYGIGDGIPKSHFSKWVVLLTDDDARGAGGCGSRREGWGRSRGRCIILYFQLWTLAGWLFTIIVAAILRPESPFMLTDTLVTFQNETEIIFGFIHPTLNQGCDAPMIPPELC